jgi:hypothetical protein
MTLLSNSQNVYAQIGIREDLTDIVALIDPQETPFVSNIKSGAKPKTIKHEWQVQTLTAPSKTNFQLDGDDAPAASAAVARVRLANYCAISRKVGAVSGTSSAVEVAGVANELDNQKMLKAVELRRDCEVIALDNNAYVTGSSLTARECAGLSAYITNTDNTGGPTAYSVAAGTGADAHAFGAGTSRAMTLSLLNSANLEAHADGGKINMLMLSPRLKVQFSAIAQGTGATPIRYNLNSIKAGALIGAVDTWLSDFGSIDVMSNVQQTSDSGTTNGLDDTAFLIDSRHAAICDLRPTFSEDLGKTGDNVKFEIIREWTLEVDAPKAHAALFCLT